MIVDKNVNKGLLGGLYSLSTAAVFFVGSAALPAQETTTRPAADDIHAANARLGRGVNLGNALEAPSEGAWGVRLKAEYFKAIKEAGFASVRLPCKWSAHAERRPPFTIDQTFANRVDWAIDQALANNLNIIVNVHHYNEMDSDPDAHLPRLIAIWKQVAARFKDRPGGVYFELLNEPHDAFTEEKWNTAIPQILAAVRETNPTRPVIIGPGKWNNIDALEKLELPTSDRRLIATVHFYEPFQFTHQGAQWVNGANAWKGKTWTGTDAEKRFVAQKLAKAADWAKKNDRPIFLGEFGAFSAAPLDSRIQWTRFVAREAEKNGFSWAYWEFCSGFGAYDPRTDQWREPLKKALLP